jgi:hypothetical protein
MAPAWAGAWDLESSYGFFGPLTLFPIVGRQPLDWSADQGTALFGSLVGYIIYGFILGTIYAFLDRIWVRLFIQSDPLNREPEGLGLHFLRSIDGSTRVSIFVHSGELGVRSPAMKLFI